MKWLILTFLIASLPFTYFLIKSLVKDIVKLRGLTKLKKAKKINYNNYETLELQEVETDHIVPKGNMAYFTFEVPDVQIAVKQKKYTGNSRAGIKLPFFRLSLQDKELYDTYSFMHWGDCHITLTNKKLRIVSYGTEPAKKDMSIDAIENVLLTDDDKTVFVSLSENVYPVKVRLNDKYEAEYFQNALWTLRFNQRVTKEKKTNKKLINSDPLLDKSITSLKKMNKNELQTIALDINSDESILKLTKADLIDFIIQSEEG